MYGQRMRNPSENIPTQVLELMQTHPKEILHQVMLTASWFNDKCGILIAARKTPFMPHITVWQGTLAGFPHSGTFSPLRIP